MPTICISSGIRLPILLIYSIAPTAKLSVAHTIVSILVFSFNISWQAFLPDSIKKSVILLVILDSVLISLSSTASIKPLYLSRPAALSFLLTPI